MNDPQRWLERNDLAPGNAVTQLLQSQRDFLPLDGAAAARVKHAVLHATGDLPAQSWAQRGVLGRVGVQLSRLGQHQFSASAVAATTLGAATLGAAALGVLLATFGSPFAASAGPGSDGTTTDKPAVAAEPSVLQSRVLQSRVLQSIVATRLGGSPALSERTVMRSARDPWAASLWNRAEGGVEGELRCEPTSSLWGATGTEVSIANPLLRPNQPCMPEALGTPEQLAAGAGSEGAAVISNRAASTPVPDPRSTASGRLVEPDSLEVRVTGNAVMGETFGRSERAVSSRPANSRSAGSRASGGSSGDPRGLREETLLLEAARSDLARNPRSALRTALEHQQQFPQGQLALQRVLIQVEALLRLGQDANAIRLTRGIQNSLVSSRAKDLLTRYGATSSLKE